MLTGLDTPVERRWSGLFEVTESLEEGIIPVVNIAGDSDTSGVISGNLFTTSRRVS